MENGRKYIWDMAACLFFGFIAGKAIEGFRSTMRDDVREARTNFYDLEARVAKLEPAKK